MISSEEKTVHSAVDTCDSVVTRSTAMESETRCEEERAPLMAVMAIRGAYTLDNIGMVELGHHNQLPTHSIGYCL